MAHRRPWEIEDELWELVEPLLPKVERRFHHPGRRRLDDRQALHGIMFVLYRGIPWEFLPQELGYGSGMTCWRRLRDWTEAGVWQQLHEVLMAKLNAAGLIDWSRAAIDGSHVPALKGGRKPARARSVDRARTGSKHHVITEGGGIPLAVTLTGGSRHDVTQLARRSRPSHRCAAVADGYAVGPTRCMPIAPTTSTSTGIWCAPRALIRSSPASTPSTAPDSGSTAGWSSRQSCCCTGSAAYVSAGKSAVTSMKPSSASPAASSAGADSRNTQSVRSI